MARLHRARVTAVGSEQDMLRMAHVMLENGDWLSEEEDGPVPTLEALLALVTRRSHWENGESCGFLDRMIAPRPFAQFVPDSCRMEVQRQACGLWTATFAFDSWDDFQSEDWLQFHLRCDRMPMFALHAGEEFAMEKGGVVFTGGAYHEEWGLMAETWLWLFHQYFAGTPTEEMPQTLKRFNALLAREWDQDAHTLLRSCLTYLQQVAAAKARVTAEALQEAKEQQNFAELFNMQRTIADGELWETEHIAMWAACLKNGLQAGEH